MNNNFNIKTIQYYPEKLNDTLKLIKEGTNIIYSNLKSSINLNGMKLKTRKFDTMLYNEKSEIIILLMRDGFVNKEQIIDYLEKNDKNYIEITFELTTNEYKEGNDIPEIYFSNDKKMLKEALVDSMLKEITYCDFYPFVEGNLSLGYMNKRKEKMNIYVKIIKGLIKLEDKIIMLIDQKGNNFEQNQNLTNNEIIEILKENNFSWNIHNDIYPELHVNDFKEKVKTLKLKK